MVHVRKSSERGSVNFGWLDTRHSFSFGEYHDPAHMGYRSLRVINEDWVAPGKGFGMHPHRDMEIFTYVVEGALEHQDSMGNGSVIRPGHIQRMTAGTGVYHSEFNPSADYPVHLLQIWLLPERAGLNPGYEEGVFDADSRRNTLRLMLSPNGEDGSLHIHQDARIFAALWDPAHQETYALGENRGAWVQVVRGDLKVNGTMLSAGDGARVEGHDLHLRAVTPAEFLLFDLK